mmetsp:Transcript_59282/g.150097  ORF Transcript_59282/g.150097 Transcript_59282/m.150097 type:complete len:787 (+) Transcript_59282:276-2636(+)
MAALLAEAEAHYEAEETQDALEKSRRAAEQLRSSGDKDALARAMRCHAMALVGLSKLQEAAEYASGELKSCRASGDRLGEAMMLLSLGNANMDKRGQKKREEAFQCAQEARGLFGELGNQKFEIEALHVLSFCAAKRSEAESKEGGMEARAFATKARELSAGIGDRRLEARSMNFIASGFAADDDLQAALETTDEALDLCLEIKDKRLEAFMLLSMAHLHLKNESPDKALSDAEDAREIYLSVRSSKEILAWSYIFDAYTVQGDRRRSLRTAKEAVKRFKAIRDRAGEADALDMCVSAYIATEQLDEALDAAEKCLNLSQDLGDRRLEAKMSSAISGLYLRMQRFDRAAQAGEDAVMFYREHGGDALDKVEAMFHIVEAYVQRKDLTAAFEAAQEMRSHFEKEGDAKGEAASLMTMTQLLVRQEKYAEALEASTKAQVLLADDGQKFGEAAALRLMAEVFSRKEEYKSSVRAAERSRSIFRELGEKMEEVMSLYLVGSSSVSLAVSEGARVGGGPGGRAATDALAKATKAAETTIKVARELQESEGLLASAQCIQAQIHMLNGKPEEALGSSDESVVLFRDLGYAASEANALLLSADALRVLRQYRDSGDAAEEALRLFRTLDPPDTKGEEFAQEILDYITQIMDQQKQQQQMKAMMAQQAAGGMTMPMAMPEEAGMPAQAVSLARQDRERGPALDLSAGVDAAQIKSKVMQIAERITGAEDGEIDADTPLMEAGLTSNSAIILRDELSAELPGVQLPVTLVFDYPSIGSMVDLIVESSSAKAIAG